MKTSILLYLHDVYSTTNIYRGSVEINPIFSKFKYTTSLCCAIVETGTRYYNYSLCKYKKCLFSNI